MKEPEDEAPRESLKDGVGDVKNNTNKVRFPPIAKVDHDEVLEGIDFLK